jgi:predicted acyltransferase
VSDAPAVATDTRLAGLDIFRGTAVAGMILVNNPGSGDYVWWPLDHAAWHGFTPTDLVFPAFLCAVGFALGLGFPRPLDPDARRTAWRRIARRSLGLIALGLAFGLLARPDLAHIRFFNVLQRIGICYAVAASFALLTARPQADGRHALSLPLFTVAAAVLLSAWWVLLTLVPVPGHGAGVLTPEGNLAGYVDRTLFTTVHIWRHGTDAAGNIVYDPEGLLSTLGALGNVLLGAAAAIWWRRDGTSALRGMAVAALGLTAIGLAISGVLPLNKRIWTSSFALLTSGLSGLLFVAAVLLGRGRAAPALEPLRMLGANALTAYCLSLLIGIAGLHAIIPDGGSLATIPAWTFARIDALLHAPLLSSALYGLLVLAVTFALLVPLHRRGLHLRL